MISTADKMDDLEIVAIFQPHLPQRRSRHNLQIALDRHLGRIEAELVGQFGDGNARDDPAMLTIDPNLDRAVRRHRLLLHICSAHIALRFAGERHIGSAVAQSQRKGSFVADRPIIFVLNGPNLNMLGLRDPEIYGHDTLDDIAGRLEDRALELGVAVDLRQSNHEGHLVDWIQEAGAVGAKAILLNAGAFTHTSIAIHDAIKSVTVPVIEVHLSNPHRREAFRHVSFVGQVAKGTIAGFGALSYMLALDAAAAF